jgi:hypothetical protein
MLYEFKPEDQQFYQLLESLDIIPYLNIFLENHKSRIRNSFENMLDEMKNGESTERDTRFIEEMDCEQFIDVVKFTFEVMFAKDLLRSSTKCVDTKILFLAAHNLAEKMSCDVQNPIYINQIEHSITNCCNSVMLEYKTPKNNY